MQGFIKLTNNMKKKKKKKKPCLARSKPVVSQCDPKLLVESFQSPTQTEQERNFAHQSALKRLNPAKPNLLP